MLGPEAWVLSDQVGSGEGLHHQKVAGGWVHVGQGVCLSVCFPVRAMPLRHQTVDAKKQGNSALGMDQLALQA